MDDKNQQRNNPKEQDKSKVIKRSKFMHTKNISFQTSDTKKTEPDSSWTGSLAAFRQLSKSSDFCFVKLYKAFSPKLKQIFFDNGSILPFSSEELALGHNDCQNKQKPRAAICMAVITFIKHLSKTTAIEIGIWL